MPSPSKRPFRVIVVGGGVGGLTLANMLERFGIDYVVLEAYKEVHPPKGAGVLLSPNGNFLMDQLGYYEKIREAAQDSEVEVTYFRNADGKLFSTTKQMPYHQEKRHGYPQLFFDRRACLKVLYDQVKYKDKILTSKRVDRIDLLDGGVKVITDKGEAFTGDIVIGADGIHSAVRREMKRHAEVISPGLFDPEEEDKVPCYYMCSYGIALDVEGWTSSSQGFTTGKHSAFLMASGPNGRVYWFLFVKLPEVKYGKDIPTYTKEDELAFAKQNAHLKITENLNFGQVFAKRIPDSCGLTPIHEIVFKKWFFGRMFLVGDSVHKPNPVGGMGANAAIETSAELLNALLDIKAQRPGNTLDGLTDSEIQRTFQRVQDKRFDRASKVVSGSHDLQALLSWENPFFSMLVLHILIPLSGIHSFYRSAAQRFKGATRLKYLPLPTRPRKIPYDHELPARPASDRLGYFIRALCLLAVGSLVYFANKGLRMETMNWRFLADSWSNISRGFTGNTLTPKFYSLYQLASMLSPLLISVVESYRMGRSRTFLSISYLLPICMLFQGVGRATLSYALLAVLHSSQMTVDRPLPIEVARSLLSALVAGFLVPAASLLFAAQRVNITEKVILTLLFLFPFITALITTVSQRMQPPKSQKDIDRYDEWYTSDDIPFLKRSYNLVFAIQTVAHVALLVHTVHETGNFSLWSLAMPFDRLFEVISVQWKGLAVLSDEMLWMRVGALSHSLYMIMELRQQGYINTASALKAAVATVLRQIFVGPGASWVSVYRWREDVILNLSSPRS